MALDQIAEDHGFSPWRSKFQGLICEGKLEGHKVLLLKPETFMNASGQAVGEAARFYKIAPENIWVFHDELDLAPGRLKTKVGGGHAGHNGLRSLHGHVGESYGRIRMGIGHPGHKDAVSGYVLRDFPKADDAWLDDMLRGCSDGAVWLTKGDPARFMNAVSLRLNPPRSGTGKKGGAATPAATPKPEGSKADPPTAEPDSRSPLERLIDRFK